jgi:glycosyltransferase involved in cell wall biosynthesis
MACSVPVVASPVGVNSSIVKRGGSGFLAATTQEWIEAFRVLIRDKARRLEFGASGRRLVEAEFSVARVAPKFCDLITESLGMNPVHG